MYKKLLRNEFKKNPGNNLMLLLFMSLSVTVAISVFFMLAQLFTSISSMYEKSNPPHFLQMHKGELDQEQIDEFNAQYEGIQHWQTVTMINVNGDELHVTGEKQFSLEECRLDISLVKQNADYDILLDENRNSIQLKPGEIGVPVILLEQFDIAIGDIVTLKTKNTEQDFVVAQYVYDGQMNSTLCSSTRFLISDEDFETLNGQTGETEYLIEAYFSDSSMASDYQTAYEQSPMNLPKDGQAITYTMIFLLSAMTDIMTALMFLIGGILLTAVALLALRYTILAAIEEDVSEIGTMKAIGIPGKGIRELYLGRVRILMTAGCIIGYLCSIGFSTFLTGHINRTFGNEKMSVKMFLLAIIICILMYVLVLFFTKKILKRIRKATVIDTLVMERGFGKEHYAKDSMHKSRRLPVNLLMGLQNVRRGYGIVAILLALVSALIMVPNQLINTMEDEDFITYMGSSACDIMIEVEQGDTLESREKIARELLLNEMKDGNIASFDETRRVRLQAVDMEGELQGIHIDTGEKAGSGLKYLAGNEPKADNEIALSGLMADQLGKKIGDKVDILTEDEQGQELRNELVVCGIYQDVTSGGKTAKTICEFAHSKAEQYTFQIDLPDGEQYADLQEQWRAKLGNGYAVENMEEFIGQTLGGMVSQVKQARTALFLIGNALVVLIILLFLKLRIAREAKEFAAKNAIGIGKRAIYLQELYPILISGGIGILTGCIFTVLLGDKLVSALLSFLGIGLESVRFVALPILTGVGIPAILIGILVIVTLLACRKITYVIRINHA